jgi:hypothetical protein
MSVKASDSTLEDWYHEISAGTIKLPELANGGYEYMSVDGKNPKLQENFRKLANRRAQPVVAALGRLIEGRSLSASELFSEVGNGQAEELF